MQTHLLTAFLSILGCLCPLSHCLTAKHGPSYRPLLVDDLGYMDIGAYNPKSFYETPHVDRLAKSGMKFTDGYAANPVCSPTRFGIQTGRYPTARTRPTFSAAGVADALNSAPLHDRMDLEEVTIAEALKKKGYATFFAGKWHLGRANSSGRPSRATTSMREAFPKEGPMEARNTFPLTGTRGFQMARTASTCPTDWRARPVLSSRKTKANRSLPCFRSTRSTPR